MSVPPVVVGVIGADPAETALRYGFEEAGRRGAPLTVVGAGPASAEEDMHLIDLVSRWSGKYPEVVVSLTARRTVDAVITLAAASRRAGLLVLEAGATPRTAASVAALARRAHCGLRIVGGPAVALTACRLRGGRMARPCPAGR
ncbi:hypothetical protein [Actinoplanes sp. L3-i22]|uniref:hypothetical protein n=1 Tax=Actinoplanes sp. L3-i22 TaxID=2836373 RepID=UPI001C7936C7|nr:hypothetical protein [Actinoplanes sp. L3-i22]BCY09412.1 hypothetical protein L3i22_045000 [Actinoplanes sp. L3-i22]